MEKVNILLVDDKPENLVALEAVLEEEALNLVKANSGNEALSLLLDHDFALVLLDVQMPEMDGYEVAQLMRGNEKFEAIPIVFVTAISQEQKNIFKGYSSGAVDFLFKPIDPDILKSKVNVFVELYKQRGKIKQSAGKLEKINTELEKKSEELQVAHNQLKEATAQIVLSERLSALGELTGGISHEMNQPLNVIKIICQSIIRDSNKDRLDNEEVRGDLTEIVVQTDKLAEIINHMRDFANGAKSKESKENFDVSTAIENAFKLVEQQLYNRKIKINEDLGSDLPRVFGNSARLEVAILNIVTNARDALEKSNKENKSISVKSYKAKDRDEVVIEITDNGEGIPEKIRSKVFQPFFTQDDVLSPTGKPTKGRGLGLSVANKILEEHGGCIELESTIKMGSTFKMILPMGKPEES